MLTEPGYSYTKISQEEKKKREVKKIQRKILNLCSDVIGINKEKSTLDSIDLKLFVNVIAVVIYDETKSLLEQTREKKLDS